MPRPRSPALTLVALLATACIDPADRRPGLWLSGETVVEPVTDWRFTDDHAEIFLETRAPLGLRQSNTIACAQANGELYVGARDPRTKRWVKNVANTPEARIEVDDRLYEVRLEALDDPDDVKAAYLAYAAKYGWPAEPPDDAPPMQYYRVASR